MLKIRLARVSNADCRGLVVVTSSIPHDNRHSVDGDGTGQSEALNARHALSLEVSGLVWVEGGCCLPVAGGRKQVGTSHKSDTDTDDLLFIYKTQLICVICMRLSVGIHM